MSYSTLWKIHKTKVISHQEFRNGWGSAPALWDYLAETHLGEKPSMFNQQQMRRVWDLFDNPTVPIHRRIALGFTFDHFVC